MKLLFIGDSVTDCGCSRKTDEFGQYGIGYVRRLAELLPGHTVINSGVSGNRVRDLIARWEADCVAHNPDVVTILIGITMYGGSLTATTPLTRPHTEPDTAS